MDEIIKAIHALESKNLQSDERFTESYISMRIRRGFGPVRIKMELKERGIGQETSDGFLAAHDNIWPGLAQSVRDKKFGKKNPNDWQEQAKQMRYLYYKGFSNDQIKEFFYETN